MIELTEDEREVLRAIVADVNPREDIPGILMRYHKELKGDRGVARLAQKLEQVMTCSFPECDGALFVGPLCETHFNQFQSSRFEGDCDQWLAAVT